MEINAMINRINALAKKKKTSGLTPEELAEQKELYKEYLSNIRSQLKAQLDNIEVVDELPDKKQLHWWLLSYRHPCWPTRTIFC